MRQTVEENLTDSTESFQASFETVSKQLESVNGLGEMKTVAQDDRTLNEFFQCKTRGILGELQPGQIIEDIMTPSQYDREVQRFLVRAGVSNGVKLRVLKMTDMSMPID